jgi:hypothetical protein
MLRITVEVVPHGGPALSRVVGVVHVANEGATSPQAAADPDGERRYAVRRLGPSGRLLREATARHSRGDGALCLAELALRALREADEPAGDQAMTTRPSTEIDSRVLSLDADGEETVMGRDFYRCPESGVWVYCWADERVTAVLPTDETDEATP